MKLPMGVFAAVLLAGTALAQSTYTTTADGCGGKNLGYCILPVHDQSGQTFQLTLDARYNSQGQINTLTVAYPFPGNTIFTVHGAYSGFVGNPNGTHTAYYGSGSFASDDSTVNGQFSFYAYYVATCSGRGCAGATVGWHYRVLTGSTVTAN